jgi:hypothetical protein
MYGETNSKERMTKMVPVSRWKRAKKFYNMRTRELVERG